MKRCLVLENLWKAGRDVMQKHICEEIEVVGFDIAGRQFNPKMKTIALKLPAKGSEIACQWECKIE